ncbi:MAG: multiheme c-type cytochrome [Anaerobacillus sp.]|uniref:multiheme c-type cytochrome n=1 Tax=Anaerobacillus sp. TaxID=1872506 RepID=UPI00391D9100
MLKFGDTRKGFILIFCLMLIIPTNAGFYMPVVFGEAIQQTEDEIIIQQDEKKEISVFILEPINRSSFNVNELVLGIDTEIEEIEHTFITISNQEEVIQVIDISALDTAQEVSVDISSYEDGKYEITAKSIVGEHEYYSNVIHFEVDRTAPEIQIITPNGNLGKDATISGNTESELLVSLSLGEDTYQTSSDEDGYFTFDLNSLVENDVEYIGFLSVVDGAGNIGETTVTFEIDQKRPYISPDVFPSSNMTQVPINTVITAQIVDNNPITSENISNNAIQVFEKGSETPIAGTVTFNENTSLIMFTPDENLNASKKYFVIIDHLLKDQAGNLLHARNWSFTTKSGANFENPHGNYQNNTNTCKTCHSVHTASKAKLEEPSDEVKERLNHLNQPVTSYCMACHDGTVASAMPEVNGHSNHNNKEMIRPDGSVQIQSCGSCHDVHLGWHETNPNLIKDHLVFDHSSTENGKDVGVIDSSVKLCESCHENGWIDEQRKVTYSQFRYSNWNYSNQDLREGELYFGKEEDYTLCLRCHNSEIQTNNPKVKDIKSLYSTSNSTSGHFISKDRVQDGSLLDGHLPCADCHDTHSSANGMLIKNTLGKNAANRSTLENWPNASVTTSVNQRTLCLSCHNDETELYGITVSLPMKRADGTKINAHQPTSTNACSNCHGGTSKTFLEAVHAPSKRGN